MAFVNEYLSVEDFEKFKVQDVRVSFGNAPINMKESKLIWTIDRDLNAYLIPVKSGREDESNIITFALWWDGVVYEATLELTSAGFDVESRIGHRRWALISISIPREAHRSREEIVSTFKSALVGYKVGTVKVKVNSYSVDFEF